MIIDCLKDTKKKMIIDFGSENVKLGEFQKLVRGNKEIPIYGLPDVLTAMRGVDHKDGQIKVTHGESYIELVKFTKNKTEIESVISYGSSDRKNSVHYSISKSHWGNGIGGKIYSGLIKYAFDQLRLHRVETYNLAINKKVIKIKENLGFKLEGVLRDFQYRDGNYLDVMIMTRFSKIYQDLARFIKI